MGNLTTLSGYSLSGLRRPGICSDLKLRPPGREVCYLLLSRFSRVRLCHPIDGSPSGSPVPGILQARTLEWVAISFSNAWRWKVRVKSFSRVRLLAIPWTAAYQAPPSMGFSRQDYWSGVPLTSLVGYLLITNRHDDDTAWSGSKLCCLTSLGFIYSFVKWGKKRDLEITSLLNIQQ